MRRFTVLTGWVLTIAVFGGCASTDHDDRMALRDAPSIDAFAAHYAEAFMSHDPEHVARVMTEDFTAVTSGKPPIIGRDAVIAAVELDLDLMEIDSLHFEIMESEVNGNSAWAWGAARGVVRMSDAPESRFPVGGYFLWILERDGARWRIRCDCAYESAHALERDAD